MDIRGVTDNVRHVVLMLYRARAFMQSDSQWLVPKRQKKKMLAGGLNIPIEHFTVFGYQRYLNINRPTK